MLIIISTSFYWSLSPIHSHLFIDLCILSWADIWCKLTPSKSEGCRWASVVSNFNGFSCFHFLSTVTRHQYADDVPPHIYMVLATRLQGTTLSHCPSLRNVPRSHSYLWAWGIHNYRPMTCKKKAWDNILGLIPICLTNDYS